MPTNLVIRDARNTGVPDGVVLTAYTGPMAITQDGTVIENKAISGSIRIAANNVVLRNCRIEYNDYFGINADGAANLTVQDCDIVGPGYGGDSSHAVLGTGTFLRNDISGAEHGISVQGPSLVKDNYIHDGAAAKADPHIGGISVRGTISDVLIEGNTVIGKDTSDIFIKNTWGPVNNIVVRNNYLAGTPGYVIYVDASGGNWPVTNISIIDNKMKKGGYGYISTYNTSPVVSGNVYLPADASPGP